MTDLAARTITCPAWCVSPHRDNDDVHESPAQEVTATDGTVLNVRGMYDSTLDSHTVWVGDREFTQDTGSDLLRAVREAIDLPLRAAVTR